MLQIRAQPSLSVSRFAPPSSTHAGPKCSEDFVTVKVIGSCFVPQQDTYLQPALIGAVLFFAEYRKTGSGQPSQNFGFSISSTNNSAT
ncbi:hypothetical protein PGT21_007368 [Puccinia graminis f. sp. tritici]|uniref:Uncharacterized protein n=1 Tax=Puccinia graminis f. sp. tritici TaxID=56615 RepID=A0A5B0MER6_PUCGR|nr:hypothetical protein PGT21_007368 [Puccinia graminis f. sp. tritici]